MSEHDRDRADESRDDGTDEVRQEPDREDIGCLKAIEMFYAYMDGELGDSESVAEFEHHLEHCRSCFSRAEFEGMLTERLRDLAAERASDALRRRLRILMDNF